MHQQLIGLRPAFNMKLLQSALSLFCIFIVVNAAKKGKEKGKNGKASKNQVLMKKVAIGSPTVYEGSAINYTFNVDIMFKKPFKGNIVQGINLWNVDLWISSKKNGKGPKFGAAMSVLTEAQAAQSLNKGDGGLLFEDVTAYLDLRDASCSSDMLFICATLSTTSALKFNGKTTGCTGIKRCNECQNMRCTRDYVPMCGSNGETYSNPCMLDVARCELQDMVKVHDGPCQREMEPTLTTRVDEGDGNCMKCPEFNPNVRCIMANPICPPLGCPEGEVCCGQSCGPTCVPVNQDCGVCPEYDMLRSPDPTSDFCSSECSNGKVCCEDGGGARCLSRNATSGPSELDCEVRICTFQLAPVCGSDGNTYSNECMFNWEKQCDEPHLTIAHQGACVGVKGCEHRICAAIFAPVCGTDGQTYSNECQLNWAVRCDNLQIAVDHQGECEDEAVVEDDCETRICFLLYDPVCGSDGETYSNPCVFNFAVQCDNPSLTKVSEGPCEPESEEDDCDSRICTQEYNPVCGSDGETYSNPCVFNFAVQCDNPSLTKVSEGPCEPESEEDDCDFQICTLEYNPVCGSDGETYSNPCMFNFAVQCDNPSLTKVSEGPCEPDSGEDDCDSRICTLEYNPVCGSDGETYSNPCVFNFAVQCDNPTLTKVSDSPCESSITFSEVDITITPPQYSKLNTRVDILGRVSTDSEAIKGSNLWTVSIFGSNDASGDTDRRYEVVQQILTERQAMTPIQPGRRFAIRNIRSREFPIWSAACSAYNHVCVEFRGNTESDSRLGPSTVYLSCIEMHCILD